MKISTAANASKGLPQLINPVNAALDIPVFYDTGKGTLPTSRIYCDRLFALCVLMPFEEHLKKHNYALLHIGVYNPRKARRIDGTPIKPERWSNHALGSAMDWKGVIGDNGHGKKIVFRDFIKSYSTIYDEIIKDVVLSIENAKRKPEIVNEKEWLHVGIWR